MTEIEAADRAAPEANNNFAAYCPRCGEALLGTVMVRGVTVSSWQVHVDVGMINIDHECNRRRGR